MSTLGIPSSRSKLFTLTHLTFAPHADVTIIFTELTRLNLLAWTPNSFNWVYWEIRRCASCGDVRPPDLPLSNTAMTPTWRQPIMYTAERHFHKRRLCILQSATSTNGDYVHCRTPLPQTTTMYTAERHFHKRRLFCRTPLPQTATMLTSWPPTFLLSTSSHPMTWSVHKPPSLKLWFVQRKD